jgi:hypothetical protein
MFLSAEVRWFWRDGCPQPLRDWFFAAGLPPGGGHPRIDRYLPQPNEAELGVKERGDKPGLEFKGLVARRESPALGAVTSQFEIWCKWSCTIPGIESADKATITKIRWLRKFDTSGPVRAEIPLDANEQPKSGHSLPVQGCNVELTEARISGRSDVWWTLGFEAFGALDTVPINLARAIAPDGAILAGIVSSGALLSYPAWLAARLAD